MTQEIPPGFEMCACCEGHGSLVVGYDPGTREEPPSERLEACRACEGEGCFPEETDEDFDTDEEDGEPGDIDGDTDFAFASAGLGMDEDYGGLSDIE